MRIILLPLLMVTAHVMGLSVTEDFSLAKELSHLYQKPLVVAFVGSDWAPPFDAADFERGIGNQCILAKIDFPEINRQPPKQMEANYALKGQYGVTSFPTMILLSPEGEEIARFGEVGSVQILEALKVYQHILTQMVTGRGSTRTLYEEAKHLGAHHLTEQLMKKGLQEEDPYFSIERYAQMVGEGSGLSLAALQFKQRGLASDPENKFGLHLRCAMLEFQAQAELENPLEAVKPLLNYINGIGQKDPDLWQIHLFISEYLMKHNLKEEALKYAESSIQGAPREIGDEVTHLILDSNEKPSEHL